MAYVTRTHGERPHAKFQPPTMTGLAVHKGQTEVQNKGNANIYVDSVACDRRQTFFIDRIVGKAV